MTNEEWYDAELAPALKALADRCNERGMSLVAVAEYEPDERGGTYSLTPEAGLAMQMLRFLGHAGENVDAFWLALRRHCTKRGIDTSQSIVMGIGS